MKNFVQDRTADLDEIWFCEHPSVLTVGRQGSPSHLLNPQDVPVVHTDRGGEVTYHGPGQIVVYPLIHLRKRGLLPKAYLEALESAVIDTLKEIGIIGFLVSGAPGVYVQGPDCSGPFNGAKKICSIGIRISHDCTYHGLSLNFDADLSFFERINPCGYKGLKTANIKSLNSACSKQEIIKILERKLSEYLIEKKH